MWGTRGPFLSAAAMVGYGCVGRCWPLEANVRLTYCRNSKNSLQKLLSLFLRRSHTFLTSDLAAKKDNFYIRYALCSMVVTHHAKESWTLLSASGTDATLDIDTLFSEREHKLRHNIPASLSLLSSALRLLQTSLFFYPQESSTTMISSPSPF
jgi:hypothetical protein